MDKNEFIGKIVEDPYGSFDDCSPGLYIEEDDGVTGILISGRNGGSYFRELEGSRVKITIEVLPDLEVEEEEDDEITVSVSYSRLMGDCWESYCDWSGTDYYAFSRINAVGDRDEKKSIPVSKAKEWGLI